MLKTFFTRKKLKARESSFYCAIFIACLIPELSLFFSPARHHVTRLKARQLNFRLLCTLHARENVLLFTNAFWFCFRHECLRPIIQYYN